MSKLDNKSKFYTHVTYINIIPRNNQYSASEIIEPSRIKKKYSIILHTLRKLNIFMATRERNNELKNKIINGVFFLCIDRNIRKALFFMKVRISENLVFYIDENFKQIVIFI